MRTLSPWPVVLTVGAALTLLVSCVSPPPQKIIIAKDLPSVVNLISDKQGGVLLRLKMDDGEERLFLLDTGCPETVLDRSLEPKLGKLLGRKKIWSEDEPKPSMHNYYQSPALYLNNTRLMTGPRVCTEDLRRMYPNDPVMGILGTDCLRHYCIHLDIRQGTMRFLDPESTEKAEPGKNERIYAIDILASGHPAVRQQFAGSGLTDWVIDTGCPADGALTPKQFKTVLKENTVIQSRKVETFAGVPLQVVTFNNIQFGDESYNNVILIDSRHQLLGLHFLARHDVTLNFPMKTMRLAKREQSPR